MQEEWNNGRRHDTEQSVRRQHPPSEVYLFVIRLREVSGDSTQTSTKNDDDTYE